MISEETISSSLYSNDSVAAFFMYSLISSFVTDFSTVATKIVVEPLQIWFKEKSWYLISYCRNKKYYRIFKIARIKEIDGQIEADTQEYESLETELEKNAGGGKIIVEDIAYPGVKLTISNVVTYIHTETQHSAFVREGADIRIRGI